MKTGLFKYLGIGLSVFFLLLLVFSPQAASGAVKNALEICSGIILPSLLPFFFISGIISALGIPALLSGACAGLMNKLFGLGGYAATPLILGFLGGYPVGAASLAELVKEGRISPREGERLLPICNNTGPAFILGAVGGGVFESSKVGFLLYFVHIISALSIGLLFSGRRLTSKEAPVNAQEIASPGLAAALPLSIKSSVEKSLNVCGFVIFFSILSSLLEEMSLISSAGIFLSRHWGLEIGFCRSLLAGIMELGGGIASMSSLSPCPRNYALAAFILGFGSLSVHCQTLAVVSEAKIKCARHFAGRIGHGLLSALYTFVLASLFRI